MKQRLPMDAEHRQACHDRWMELRNRRQEEQSYKDEWYAEQCGSCRFFVPLQGLFSADWGGCSNAKSPFDGRVMFEHDGCEFFELSEDD
jgi:hypothetical protein